MAINWTKLYTTYKGMWVALKADEKTVIASGRSAKAAHTQAVKVGVTKPILSFIPRRVIPMVGTS